MAVDTVPTRIMIISDTHDLEVEGSFKKSLPEVDVLLHCGDLTEYGGLANYEKAIRLMSSIRAELRLFIAGNHDISLDESFYASHTTDMHPTETHAEALALCTGPMAQAAGAAYLTEGTHTFTLSNGARLTIYASPYSTRHGDWAFQHLTTEDRYNSTTPQRSLIVSTATETSIIPSFPGVAIVMTHGPPRYMLDSFSNSGSAGCEHLFESSRAGETTTSLLRSRANWVGSTSRLMG